MDERGYLLLRIIASMGPLEVEDLARIASWMLGDEVEVLEALRCLEEERLVQRRGSLVVASLRGLEAVSSKFESIWREGLAGGAGQRRGLKGPDSHGS